MPAERRGARALAMAALGARASDARGGAMRRQPCLLLLAQAATARPARVRRCDARGIVGYICMYTCPQVRYGWDDAAEINQLLASESRGANYELRVRWRSSEELHVLCNHRGAAAAARLLTHALGASVDTSVLQPPQPPAADEAGGGEAAGRSGREAAGGDAASRREEVKAKAQRGASGGAAALRRTLGGLEGMVMHLQVSCLYSNTTLALQQHNPCALAQGVCSQSLC